MIVQTNKMDEVRRLWINSTSDSSIPVTVQVDRSGQYKVTIFTIGDMVILDSTGEYTAQVEVSDIPLPTTQGKTCWSMHVVTYSTPGVIYSMCANCLKFCIYVATAFHPSLKLMWLNALLSLSLLLLLLLLLFCPYGMHHIPTEQM